MGDSTCVRLDMVCSTYALVSGCLETTEPRDQWGVITARESSLYKSGVSARPVVSIYANLLLQRLHQTLGPELQYIERWPGGKRYAIVLTHDVDVPLLYRSPGYHLKAVKLNAAARAWPAAARNAAAVACVAPLTWLGLLGPSRRDPNLRFEEWLEVEAKLSTTSCFFVAVTNFASQDASPFDVSYDLREPRIQALLRQVHSAQWEIGLHASINSRQGSGRVAAEKAVLDEMLGEPHVLGVRHHFLALDAGVPERTLRLHVAAGLAYDSSLGFNDIAGFRRGVAWPYEPFDRDCGRTMPILEVPLTIMDSAIIRPHATNSEVLATLGEHLAQVKACGGAAVINWHLESLSHRNRRGRGRVILGLLRDLAKDGDSVWLSPGKLVSWWRERRDRIRSLGRSG
jgi:hypothetical protein